MESFLWVKERKLLGNFLGRLRKQPWRCGGEGGAREGSGRVVCRRIYAEWRGSCAIS